MIILLGKSRLSSYYLSKNNVYIIGNWGIILSLYSFKSTAAYKMGSAINLLNPLENTIISHGVGVFSLRAV